MLRPLHGKKGSIMTEMTSSAATNIRQQLFNFNELLPSRNVKQA